MRGNILEMFGASGRQKALEVTEYIKRFISVTAVDNVFTLNLALGFNFEITIADSVAKTIVFTNVPADAGYLASVSVRLNYYTAAAITHPAGNIPKNGIAPLLLAGCKYNITYCTFNNGTTWDWSIDGPWPRIVVDEPFNKADSATTMGQTYAGQAWDPFTFTFGISGNKAYTPTSVDNQLARIESGIGNGVVITKVQAVTATVPQYAGQLLRVVDASNYLALLRNNNEMKLVKVVAGTSAQLGIWYGAPTLAADDELKSVMNGNQIDCYINNVLKIQYTLAGAVATLFPSTVTKHGILISHTNYRLDDFKVMSL